MSSNFQGRKEALLNRPKIALKIVKVKVSIIGCILCLSIEKLFLDIEQDIQERKISDPLLFDPGIC